MLQLHPFLTSATVGGEWSVHGETATESNLQVPGWAPEPVWTVWRKEGVLVLPLNCALQSLM